MSGRRDFLRNFVGAVAAAVAFPPLELSFSTILANEPVVTWDDLGEMLKQVYPVGSFTALIEAESPFRRAMRSSKERP